MNHEPSIQTNPCYTYTDTHMYNMISDQIRTES